MFWVISVYFNIRNTLPKSGTFLLGHPVYVDLKTNLIMVLVVAVKKIKTDMAAVKSDQVNWHFIKRCDGDEYRTLL